MRLLPSRELLKPVVMAILEGERSLSEDMPLLGTLLQYTNAFNFSIMCRVRALKGQTTALSQGMLERRDLDMAKALVRAMTA